MITPPSQGGIGRKSEFDDALGQAPSLQLARPGAAGRPRILFVTPSSPFELSSGTQQRSHFLLRAMQRVADVDVVVLAVGNSITTTRSSVDSGQVCMATAPERRDLARFAPNPELTRQVEQALGARMQDYAMVLGRYMWAGTQLAIPRDVPIVVDLDDFGYRYGPGAAATPAVMLERSRKWFSRRLATRQLPRFRAAFFASQLEQASVNVDSMLLPNVPLSAPQRPSFESAGERILFVGSLWYRPNRDGADWLVDRVWPLVRKARPNATLKLVGAASPEVRERWTRQPGVEAPGFAQDLRAEYEQAALVVVPIHSGGGSNIKLLEALAHGRACVATRFCVEAFGDELRDGVEVFAADDPAAFAQLCLDLLGDAPRRATLARNGHDAVSSSFTQARFDAVVAAMIRKVCP